MLQAQKLNQDGIDKLQETCVRLRIFIATIKIDLGTLGQRDIYNLLTFNSRLNVVVGRNSRLSYHCCSYPTSERPSPFF